MPGSTEGEAARPDRPDQRVEIQLFCEPSDWFPVTPVTYGRLYCCGAGRAARGGFSACLEKPGWERPASWQRRPPGNGTAVPAEGLRSGRSVFPLRGVCSRRQRIPKERAETPL